MDLRNKLHLALYLFLNNQLKRNVANFMLYNDILINGLLSLWYLVWATFSYVDQYIKWVYGLAIAEVMWCWCYKRISIKCCKKRSCVFVQFQSAAGHVEYRLARFTLPVQFFTYPIRIQSFLIDCLHYNSASDQIWSVCLCSNQSVWILSTLVATAMILQTEVMLTLNREGKCN